MQTKFCPVPAPSSSWPLHLQYAAKTAVMVIAAALHTASCSNDQPVAVDIDIDVGAASSLAQAVFEVSDCPPGSVIFIGDETDEEIFGTADVNCIFGMGGNDTITGANADDWLSGGPGDDTIDGGRGIDHIDGGDGNDFIAGGNGADFLEGGDGNDVIIGGGADDNIDGGLGDDLVLGGKGADVLIAGGGNDVIDGGKGADTCNGDLCDDTGGAPARRDVPATQIAPMLWRAALFRWASVCIARKTANVTMATSAPGISAARFLAAKTPTRMA